MYRGDGNPNRKKRRQPRSSAGTAGRRQAPACTAQGGRCRWRWGALHAEAEDRWGPAQGGAVPCCLGAWGQEADLRSTGRMQGVAARREQRQRPGGEKGGGQCRRQLQMQKKTGAGDRGLGCLYRGGEGILGLRVKKNGGTRAARIGLRRKKNGPDR